MNEWIFVVKDLILTSPFHTEHNETPELRLMQLCDYYSILFSRLSLLSLLLSPSLSLFLCWWWGVVEG